MAVKMLAESLDEGNRLTVCVLYGLYIAQGSVGAYDRVHIAGSFGCLCFQDTIAIRLGQADKGNDGMVFDNLLIIIYISVFEIELAAGASADIWARELAAVVERLQNEGFTIGQAVNIDESKGMVDAEAEGRGMAVHFLLDQGNALCDRHVDVPGTKVFIWQRNAHDISIFNHAPGKGL